MLQPTTAEIRQLLKDNPLLESVIKAMLEFCINRKDFILPEDMDTQILEYSVVKKDCDYVSVRLDSFLVCHVFLNIAQDKLHQPLPDDPFEAIQFVNAFCRLIREPKPNNRWYMGLEEELHRYAMVLLNQEKGIDVASVVINIGSSENFDDLQLIRAGQRALPYMNESVPQTYKVLLTLLKDSPYMHSFDEPIFSLVDQNPQKAGQLFHYFTEQGVDTLPVAYEDLLIGLYKTNEDFYFERAINYFGSHPDKGAIFSKFNYGSAEKLAIAYDLVKEHPDLYQKSHVFAAIVANIHCPEELTETIFDHFRTFAIEGDEDFQEELALLISYLPGFDKEKMQLFPVFEKLGTRNFYMEWFQRFDSPDDLLDLIRSAYKRGAENTDIQRFEFWLYAIKKNHPVAFEAFLEELRAGEATYGHSAAQTIMEMLENEE